MNFFDAKKLYTKEELEELIKLPIPITMSHNHDGELFPYYVLTTPGHNVEVDRKEVLTTIATAKGIEIPEDIYDLEYLYYENVGHFSLLDFESIPDIMNEACDKVWYARALRVGKKNANDVIQKIEQTYGITKSEGRDSFFYGYWSGILAFARYISEDYDRNLDVLRDGLDGILDT